MSEYSADLLDRYQYITFKWVLFVVFMVMAFQFLDHHIGLVALGKRLLDWLRLLFKSGLL